MLLMRTLLEIQLESTFSSTHGPALRLSDPKPHTKSNLSVHWPQDDLNKTHLTVMSPSDSMFFKINSLLLGAALKALPPLIPAQLFDHFCPYPQMLFQLHHPE